MLSDEQYSGFSHYTASLNPHYHNLDYDMKRTQDSIGGPDPSKIKKARIDNLPFYQSASTIGQTSSPAQLYTSPANAPFANSNQTSISNVFTGMNTPNGMQAGTLGYPNSSPQGQAPPTPNTASPAQAMFAQNSPQQQQFQQQFIQNQQQQQAQAQLMAMNAAAGMMNGGMNMLSNGMPNMYNNMPLNMGYGFPQMANAYQQHGLSMGNQLTMNPSHAVVATGSVAGNSTGRTVYIGNLPADASVDELLNLVHFGPLEAVRVLPEKSCVFISFLDGATAAAFHADATVKKLSLHGQELKIGWGKPSPVPSQECLLGGLDENMTEEQLRDDLSRFGLIDQVKIVRDKNIGFVHFLSISTATKVVATLPTEPAWAGKRVNYGKDRCAYVPKTQQNQQTQLGTFGSIGSFSPFSPLTATAFGVNGFGFDTAVSNFSNLAGQQHNRTVYLGNIHPETTTEDLCNTIRGGILHSLRYMQDKHIAFVTFVDAAAAYTFYNVASLQGITLNNRRLKVGWGKSSGALSPALALSIHAGATRNVYVGNIEDYDLFTVEKLKRDFGEYGEIELVNTLKEKNCAFVNFTNITNAIKAIDGIKNKPDYVSLRIAYGKDRCANPPRAGLQNHRNKSGNRVSPVPGFGEILEESDGGNASPSAGNEV
ncbi:uncharacterized protein EI90DRAFT_3156415 [Cantharellus anzutake]|uniref:uncharacterized protein n=1 Tax=Cantharellus anzutake TaxID=1750568 RepID=UPI0019080596|nr:uncharacterized protein EI90DRAFT_3156415 [Cantharellus anzutake]KAF8326821.1 hypothetical protein EI90DRAFT_3156415 [Cantharellus anzutake]